MAYVPERSFSQHAGSRLGTYKAPNRRNRYSLIAGAVLLAVLLAAAWLQGEERTSAGKFSDVLTYDMNQLWSWSDRTMDAGAAGAEWTIRWDFTAQSDGVSAWEAAADSLFRDRQGRLIPKRATSEGRSLTAEWLLPGSRLSLHAAEQSEQGIAMIALLVIRSDDRWKVDGEPVAGKMPNMNNSLVSKAGPPSGDSLTLENLLQSAELISSRIEQTGAAPSASVKTHGWTMKDGAAAEVERLSLGKRLETYEEGGTTSLTLYSSMIKSSGWLDEARAVNMQVAAHRNTERPGRTDLTIGIPLIIGDFASD